MAQLVPSAEVETLYNQKRLELLGLIKSHSTHFFDKKEPNARVGLLNQGATCYLNALLQALNNDAKFLRGVFSSTSNSLIVSELSRLFASMLLSDHSTISTKKLTAAFGWSEAMGHDQSDVHELFSVLMEAIGSDASDLGSSIQGHYSGAISDTLQCPQCDYSRESSYSFLTLTLNFPPRELETDMSLTLQKLIDDLEKPEVLDENNLWVCSNCSQKVRGIKSQRISKWPDGLFIHLNRLAFSPATMRKVKLLDAVYFTRELTCGGDAYRLASVLVHTGNAHGGHYRTFNLCGEHFIEFNDSVALELSPTESDSLFWYTDEKCDATSAEQGRRQLVYENAYMLLYVRCDDFQPEVYPVEIISSKLRESIAEENGYLSVMRPLFDYHQKLVEVTIYDFPTNKCKETLGESAKLPGETYKTIVIHGTNPLEALVTKSVCALYPDFEDTTDIKNFRLRRYNPFSDCPTNTFTGKENESLIAIGIRSRDSLCLERKLSEETFVDYTHGRDIVVLNIYFWVNSEYDATTELNPADLGTMQFLTRKVCTVQLPAADVYVVGDIRSAVVTAIESALILQSDLINVIDPNSLYFMNEGGKLKIDPENICLVSTDAVCLADVLDLLSINSVFELLDDDEGIPRRFQHDSKIFESLVVELKTEDKVSQAFDVLKRMKDHVRINFNIPFKNELELSSDAYSDKEEDIDLFAHFVVLSSSSTLVDLKMAIYTFFDKNLNELTSKGYVVPKDFSPEGFHLCRRDGFNQIKEDSSKTLKDASITNRSSVLVKMGEGMKVGQFTINLELDTGKGSVFSNRLVSFGTIKATESWKVSEFKERIFDAWDQLSASFRSALTADTETFILKDPVSARYLRVRDVTGNYQVLRDDRILARVLLGLSDGKKVIIQVLGIPEVIGKADLVLYSRVLSFQKKNISSVLDGVLVIRRDYNAEDLLNSLRKLHFFDNDLSLSVAKGFTSGPPLTLKSAGSMKWVELNNTKPVSDSEMESSSSSSSSPFLGMRDGSFLLVKRTGDDLKVAPVESSSTEGKSSSMSKSKFSKFSDVKSLGPAREKSLKINTSVGESFKVPEIPTRDTSGDGEYTDFPASGPAVRVVQSLHNSSSPPTKEETRPAVTIPPIYIPDSVLLLGFPGQPLLDEAKWADLFSGG